MKETKNNKIAFFIVLMLVAIIVYSPVLKYGFTNWDDDKLILENPDIRQLDKTTVTKAFSKGYVGMYEPVAILFIALEYQLYSLDPFYYHLSRLALHLIACLFVYLLLFKILESFSSAIIITTIFALHPAHGEGFIWAGATNTILSNVFVIAGLYTYALFIYREKKTYSYFFLTFVLFLVAVFTKASAVVFPVLLFGIDYLTKQGINRIRVLEKGPFLLISLLIAIVTIKIRPVEEIGKSFQHQMSNLDHISLISYSLWHYISNSIVPINLSPYHAYPFLGGKNLPAIFYLSIIFVILSAVPFLIKRFISKKILFGAFLFLCPLMLVLPYKLIMKYVVADRYLYVPVIGIFIIIVFGAQNLTKKKGQLKIYFITGFFILIGFYVYQTRKYIKIWENSGTLWTYVISKDPMISDAWLNRGTYQLEKNNLDGALHDFNQFYKLKPNDYMVYANRGLVYARQKKYDLAIKDFSEGIKLNHEYAKTWSNRANVYHKLKKYDLALTDIQRALSLDSTIAEAYFNKGNIIADMGDIMAAIPAYSQAIMLKPEYKEAWFIRGMAKIRTGDKHNGCADLIQAERLGYTWARKKYDDFCE